MPHTITKTVYKFGELNNSAKDRVRQQQREAAFDYDWWDSIYEDAIQIANILGIEFRQRPVKLCGGGTRDEPAIFFSGFSSQGDGACFEGTYSYKKECAKKIREYAPKDAELLRIATALQCVQRGTHYRLSATTRHSGHYSHSGCMDVDVTKADAQGEDMVVTEAEENEITKCLRDFANWIYMQLEVEHDFLSSDEQIDESIEANDSDYEEDGSLVS